MNAAVVKAFPEISQRRVGGFVTINPAYAE